MNISHIVYSKNEPQSKTALWLRPIGDSVCLYISDGRWKPLKLVNDMGTFTVRDDTVIDVAAIVRKIDSILEGMYYRDLYIGIGSDVQDVLTTRHHFSILKKGTEFSFPSIDGKVFVVMSSTDHPTVLMSSIQVPVDQEEDITVSGRTYHVWCSENSYSGDVPIVLL